MADVGILYDDGVLTIRATTNGLAFAGEIDRDACPVLRRALKDAAAQSDDSIHLDLGAVTYCDTAGLNTLIYPAVGLNTLIYPAVDSAGNGRTVVLHATPSWLCMMLRLLGWDCLPGIQMVEGAQGQ